jgi:hypothetical protein
MRPSDLSDLDASSVELGVLIAYMDDIVHAVDARERDQVPMLLDEPIATHLPREVREELAAFAAQSANSFRAPIQFLRYRYRMLQLAAGEAFPLESQLDLGLGSGSGWRSAADESPPRGDDEVDSAR